MKAVCFVLVFIEKKNVCVTEISLIEIFTPWQLCNKSKDLK